MPLAFLVLSTPASAGPPVEVELVCPKNSHAAGAAPPDGHELWCEDTTLGEGRRNGPTLTWYEGGTLWYRGEYVLGKAHGSWSYWHENGNMQSQGAFLNGAMYGAWTYWYESGVKKSEGSYVTGMKTGSWTLWSPDGALDHVEEWQLGARVK